MRWRHLLPALLFLVIPPVLGAQPDDKTYLAGLLEDQLSGAGREVVIDGFQGALSSRASIARLSVADDQGIWLTLDNVVLDWNRSALLAGRVEVQALTAEHITLTRKPLPETSGPTAEARGFRLPDLPVSVQIDTLRADRIDLGPAVLGEAVSARLEAGLSLAGGEGQITAQLTRTDGGPAAQMSLQASYAQDSRALSVNLTATEAQGGLVARLLGLPGTPSTELSVQGSGPIDDFTAALRLATNGTERLQGRLTLTGTAQGARGFGLDVAGDIAPLFLPDYAEFFGPQVALKLQGARSVAGGLHLSDLSLTARALRLAGSLDLARDGLPERLDLTGQLASPDGAPVRLPLPGRVEVAKADLALRFDAAQGEGWAGNLVLQGLDRDDLQADRLALTASGRIARPAGKPTVTASLQFDATGLQAADPGLTQALGEALSGTALILAQPGGVGLRLPRLALTGAGFDLAGSGTMGALSDGLPLQGRVTTKLADLSRLSTLAGRPLAGSARLNAAGQGRLLAGDFDLTAEMAAQDLALGQAQLDRLLAGASALRLNAARDSTGTRLRDLTVTAGPLDLSAKGALSSEASDVTADLTLADLGRIDPQWSGGLTARLALSGPEGARKITLTGNGRNLALGRAALDRLLAGQTTLTAALGLSDGQLVLEGASLENPQLTAQAAGTVAAGRQELDLTARLANLAIFAPEFPGPARLSGRATPRADGYGLDLRAEGPGGIDASVTGRVAKGFDTADLAIRGRAQAALANPFLSGRLISGPLSFDLALRGPLALSGLTGRVTLTEGRIADPAFAVALQNVSAQADLGGGRAQVSGQAALTTGGRVSMQGSVALAPPRQADLDIELGNAVLRDPRLFETMADGRLNLSGPLTGGATLSGRLDLAQTELRIPSTSGGRAADLPELVHQNEPAPVRDTRAKAGLLGGADGLSRPDQARPLQLDVVISAPNRLFLRGRGLDAELGGRMRLQGTTRDVRATGAFSLLRGRLDLLGRRLTLTEATLAMEGRLVPTLAIAASSENDGITSSIRIEGPATEPRVSFTSSPDLPEEEVLAHLLFGRDLTTLSPLQAAQLANAVATLSGRGGAGIVGRLRAGFGLDDLDVKTDEAGTAAVTAGKYLSEKVYSEVVVGSEGQSEIHLNLDVTDSITLRGRAGNDGSTGVGVFFEKDY